MILFRGRPFWNCIFISMSSRGVRTSAGLSNLWMASNSAYRPRHGVYPPQFALISKLYDAFQKKKLRNIKRNFLTKDEVAVARDRSTVLPLASPPLYQLSYWNWLGNSTKNNIFISQFESKGTKKKYWPLILALKTKPKAKLLFLLKNGAFFGPPRGLRPLDPRACGRPWGLRP